MNIIYHCVGGAHSSVLASAIHLGLLPIDSSPTVADILSIPYFDTLAKHEQGRLMLRGIDENGNKIFTLSRQFSPHLVLPAIKDAYQLGGGDTKDLLFVNVLPAVNTIMKIGGFSSRRLNLVALGRPIVAYGSIRAFNKIAQIVNHTKIMIDNS